jgi:hypothetical protein
MYSDHIAIPGATRGLKATLALTLAASLMAALPAGLLAQDSTQAAEDTASAEPSVAPAKAACESADDLGLIVEFLQDTDAEEDGWLPVIVGAIAGLSEARTLVGLVGETYQPLVGDLITSLQDIRVTVDGLDDIESTGAQITAVGETITDIGTSMDALGAQLRTSCPTD